MSAARLLRVILGRDAGPPRVVRSGARVRQRALVAACALLALFALYVAYELGRFHAGYDRQAAALERTALEVKIEHLEKEGGEMRTKLAELDTVNAGRAREQAEVARQIGDLQSQLDRQSQELAFYRGVVQQNATAIGLKVEQLRIREGPRPGTYTVHLALVRTGRPEGNASGTIRMSLDGEAGGSAKTLDFPALTGGRVREMRYDFRYLGNFEQQLTVPASFRPGRLAVEVESARKDVPPLTQTFLWTVEP